MISDIESLEKFLLDGNTDETFDPINLNVYGFLFNNGPKILSRFINKAKEIHGDKYDYSYVDYKSRIIEVTIKCNNCGNIFNIKPKSHLVSKKGCSACYSSNEDKRLMKEKIFIDKLEKMYGSNFIYTKIKYFNSKRKVIITCSKCMRDYKRQPETFVRGNFKCRPCSFPKKK
ncbi:hypothetical protein [Moumouvirus maliensis]|nr:hypothetical protein [Moumouvirus maliensis]